MRTRMTGLMAIAALTMALGMGTQARAVDIYVLTNNDIGTSVTTTDFGRIDSVTGIYTSIASLNASVQNLAWNPAASNFFVTEGTAFNNMKLRTLSTSGVLSASLGNISSGRVNGMAYRDVDSRLYAYSFSGDSTGIIDKTNGNWTLLNNNAGITTSPPPGGRYSIMNDTIYFAPNTSNGGRFGTMGYTASSTFQSISSDSLYANMALANDGTTMFGIFGNGTANQQRLYTIDTTTGALTPGQFISGTGLGTYFKGASVVPEPSTYALGAIGTLTMAWLARRRRAKA